MPLRLQLRRLVVLPQEFVSFDRYHAEIRGQPANLRALVEGDPRGFLCAAGGAQRLIEAAAWVPELQRCVKCGLELGPEEFYGNGHGRFSRRECRACYRARQALSVRGV